MINPRAKVYLEWSSKKDIDVNENTLACTNDGVVVKIILQPTTIASSINVSIFSCVASSKCLCGTGGNFMKDWYVLLWMVHGNMMISQIQRKHSRSPQEIIRSIFSSLLFSK